MTSSSEIGGEGTASSSSADVKNWDLTSTISPYLDLHMMFPLLEYVDSLIEAGLVMPSYNTADVAQARLSLLRPTHMVDYAMDIYRELKGEDAEVPQEMEIRKKAVYEKMEELRAGCAALEELCANETAKGDLADAGKWNVSGLESSNHGVTRGMIETYRQFAKFNYDCGDYQACRDMLDIYLSLHALPPAAGAVDEKDELEDERYQKQQQKEEKTNVGNPKMYYLPKCKPALMEILWGKLSCEILVENWEEAGVAFDAVKTGLEELASTGELKPLESLVQRTWLLHWGLFVFWNNNSASSQHGLEQMVELFTAEKYLQAITTNAPHLLRYLTAAVLLIKRRKSAAAATGKAAGSVAKDSARLMKDLVKIMQYCDYTDPIVEFVECLCVKFDFESAQIKLMECERVLETDFFLCRQTALFMEEARVFVFENYCRIHHKIDLSVLGEKLAMEPAQAERWIVDLIRNAHLDAKIDSSQGCVVMGVDRSTVYEQVMERTRDLNIRSSTMAQNLQTILDDIRKEKKRRAKVSMEDDY